jgi:hypothetical protein
MKKSSSLNWSMWELDPLLVTRTMIPVQKPCTTNSAHQQQPPSCTTRKTKSFADMDTTFLLRLEKGLVIVLQVQEQWWTRSSTDSPPTSVPTLCKHIEASQTERWPWHAYDLHPLPGLFSSSDSAKSPYDSGQTPFSVPNKTKQNPRKP